MLGQIKGEDNPRTTMVVLGLTSDVRARIALDSNLLLLIDYVGILSRMGQMEDYGCRV